MMMVPGTACEQIRECMHLSDWLLLFEVIFLQLLIKKIEKIISFLGKGYNDTKLTVLVSNFRSQPGQVNSIVLAVYHEG
jgi:hypothetical protein